METTTMTMTITKFTSIVNAYYAETNDVRILMIAAAHGECVSPIGIGAGTLTSAVLTITTGREK